jgi:hypothetical protein
MTIVCNICDFKVPYDEIGVAIMYEHIRVEHPEEYARIPTND